MRKELKEASEFYDYAAEAGTHPVSLADAQIIDYVQKIARLLPDKDFAKVLSEWKVKSTDQQVLDKLVEVWSRLDTEAEQGTQKEEERMKDWIELDGDLWDLSLIRTISKGSRYNSEHYSWEYLLIINENPKEIVMYGNKALTFRTPVARDEALEKLKDKLREFTNIRFL